MKICKNICNNTKKYIPDFLFIIYILIFLYFFDSNTKDLELIISAGFLVCSFFLLEIIILYHLDGIFNNRFTHKMKKFSTKLYILSAIIITIIKYLKFNHLITNILLSIIFYILFIKIADILTSEKYRGSVIIPLLEYYLVFVFTYFIFANLFQEIIKPCISSKYSNYNKSSDYRDYNDLKLYIEGYLIPLSAAVTITISTVLSFLSSYFFIYKKHSEKKIKKRYVNIYNIISVFLIFFSKTFNYFQDKDVIENLKFTNQFSDNNLLGTILVILIAAVEKYSKVIYFVLIYMLIFVNLHEEENGINKVITCNYTDNVVIKDYKHSPSEKNTKNKTTKK